MIKQALSFATQREAFEIFVTLLERADGHPSGLLRVPAYHGVDEPLQLRWINVGKTTKLLIQQAQLLSWAIHLNKLQTLMNAQ